MEHTMSPIEEEIFNEVHDKDLRKELAKLWKIIEAYPDSPQVRNIDWERIDY